MATEQAHRGSLVLGGTGNVPDLLSRLCGGDLGMSRKSKAFLMCCVSQGCEAGSLPMLGVERALCWWKGWAGGGGKLWGVLWGCCRSAPCPEPAANILAPLCRGMLSSGAGSHTGPVIWDQHTPLLRGAQGASAAAQPQEGLHGALCLGPPVLGGQGWCIVMCSRNAECRC